MPQQLRRFLLAILLLAVALGSAHADEASPGILNLTDLCTEEGFLAPGGFVWGTPLNVMLPDLPHPETMTPGDPAFSESARRTSTENGFVSLYPQGLYFIDGVGLPFSITWEYTAEEVLFGCFISTGVILPEDLDAQARESCVRDVRTLIQLLSAHGEPLVWKGSPEDLSFDGLQSGLRLFWAGADGTFSQLSATGQQGFFIVSIGMGVLADWSDAAALIASLSE